MGKSQEKGKKFEQDIEKIFTLIAENDRLNALVKRDVKIIGRNGLKEQFDIVFNYEHLGHNYRVAIECKNYESKSVEKAEMYIFEKKVKNVGNLNGIFIAKNNLFQKGATIAAEDSGIVTVGLQDLDSYISGIHHDFLIPNSKTIGEPFWTLINKRKNIQSILELIGDTVYLFESQYFATKFLENISRNLNENIEIIGVSQKFLNEIIELKKNKKIKIKIFNFIFSNIKLSDYKFLELDSEELIEFRW